LLSRKASDQYEAEHSQLLKVMRSFKPLLTAISNGPNEEEELEWLWPKAMTRDCVNAETMLQWAEDLQPGSRDLLESEPEFVVHHFLAICPEEAYAGVDREFSPNTIGLTLREHFNYLLKYKNLPPSASQRPKPANKTAESEADDKDDSDERVGKEIRCRKCGRQTNTYDERQVGLQHFVILDGREVEMETPVCSSLLLPPRRAGNSIALHATEFEERLHCSSREKFKAEMAVCGACGEDFQMPAMKASFADHLRGHLRDVEASPQVNLGNQFRIRAAIEPMLGVDGQ